MWMIIVILPSNAEQKNWKKKNYAKLTENKNVAQFPYEWIVFERWAKPLLFALYSVFFFLILFDNRQADDFFSSIKMFIANAASTNNQTE